MILTEEKTELPTLSCIGVVDELGTKHQNTAYAYRWYHRDSQGLAPRRLFVRLQTQSLRSFHASDLYRRPIVILDSETAEQLN